MRPEFAFGGEVVFERNYGERAGTFECTQTVEDPDRGTGVLTLTVAPVGPAGGRGR